MGKKALVFLADGFEEIEAVTQIDYLRRAGVEVTTAAITDKKAVEGAHGINITADISTGELAAQGKLSAAAWDAVSIPGGMPGASNLAACSAVGTLYRDMAAAGKITAAICASPAIVLAPLGLLDGKRWTCYPGMEDMAAAVKGGKYSTEKVVVDGNLITSRGPGTAVDYALAIVHLLAGETAAKQLAKAALLS